MGYETYKLMGHLSLVRGLIRFGSTKVEAVKSVIRTYELDKQEAMRLVRAMRLEVK